ncbi:MAG: plastocyanin/azurin family copper-binding protein [Chloroflexaceae bacterium]|jgi:azurin|nr:plastocyanin/azurin family copper-binding protein [Chloroflexaceae bacterium]
MKGRHTVQRQLLLALVLLCAGLLAACNRQDAQPQGSGSGTNLTIGVPGMRLLFDRDTLSVPANAQISLTFNNSNAGLQHNWVLVRGGDSVAAAVNDGGQTQPDFLPSDRSQIIAATRVLNSGESETISFTAPGPGSYSFICTVPGHFIGGMKGVLRVE